MIYFGSILQDTLRAKYKGCEYVCGETYESLIWMECNTIPKPNIDQLTKDVEDYKINKNAYDYSYLRHHEYPSIRNQLDMLWHSMNSGEIPKSTAFYNAISAVKDKYPSI